MVYFRGVCYYKKVLTNRMIVIFYSIPIYIGMGNMAYRGN